MRSVLALMRASYLTATSYRLAMVLSIAGLAVMFIPVFFVSRALQPIAAPAIQAQGGDYFAFLIIGMAGTYLFSSAVGSLPGAVSGSVANGTLEALFVTRTPLYQVLIGMAAYGTLWNALRVLLLLGGAAAVGVDFVWRAAPAAAVVLAMMMAAYFAIGLIGAALLLMFRTSGPFVPIVLMGSGLLGGVYYPTAVIPDWLQGLSVVVPATYALRPVRSLLLNGSPLADVAGDVAMLAALTALICAVATVAFLFALRYARTAGTLAQY